MAQNGLQSGAEEAQGEIGAPDEPCGSRHRDERIEAITSRDQTYQADDGAERQERERPLDLSLIHI